MSIDQRQADTGPENGVKPPRTFISYSHDSSEHKDLVRRFATFLRTGAGVDAHLDQWYEYERRDWSVWAIRQLTEADFILAVASPEYRKRVDGFAPPDAGRGAQFEAAILRDNLTRNLPAETRRILPVVLPGRSVGEIPTFLCAYSTTHYVIREFTLDGINDLLVAFTGMPEYELPVRGPFVGPRFGSREPAQSGPEPASEPAGRRLLTDTLKPVRCGSDVRLRAADLDGRHHGHSIVYAPSLFCNEAKGVIEYNLSREYRSFESVAGVLDDASDAGQTGYFQVFLDGAPQPAVRARCGEPARITCEVSGVLRLRLEAYRPDTVASPLMAGALIAGGGSGRMPELAWGDPTLFR